MLGYGIRKECARDSVGGSESRGARWTGRESRRCTYTCLDFYRGDGLGGGLGIPVVSYAPLPMLVILDESKTAIVMSVWNIVCLWLESGT